MQSRGGAIPPAVLAQDSSADKEKANARMDFTLGLNIQGGFQQNINALRRELKRQEHSLYNRLRSIILDAEHVSDIRQKFFPSETPLIANLRCGLWYAKQWTTTCYFKSTDGHCNHWQFNLKRLNLHVPSIAAEHNGCIIVDATRKGKRALASRNGNSNRPEWTSLQMPPWIPRAEQSLVERIIISFARQLEEAEPLAAELERLAKTVPRPLKCIWIDPDLSAVELSNLLSKPDSCIPIYLLSASSAARGQADSTYIQGGADDQETWSLGMTPKVFWRHHEYILDSSSGVDDRILEVVAEEASLSDSITPSSSPSDIIAIGPTGLHVGTSLDGTDPSIWQRFDAVMNCSAKEYSSLATGTVCFIHLPLSQGKSDRYKLSKILPRALEFYSSLTAGRKSRPRVLIHSSDEISGPICICLAILVRYFDGHGNLRQKDEIIDPTKHLIKQSLLYLSTFTQRGELAPRWMLADVNRFFLCSIQPKVLLEYRKAEQIMEK